MLRLIATARTTATTLGHMLRANTSNAGIVIAPAAAYISTMSGSVAAAATDATAVRPSVFGTMTG